MEIKNEEQLKNIDTAVYISDNSNTKVTSKKRRSSIKETISNLFKGFSEKKQEDPKKQKYIRLEILSSDSSKENKNKFVMPIPLKNDDVSKSYTSESLIKKSSIKKFSTEPSLTGNKKSTNFSEDCDVFVFNENRENMPSQHKEGVKFDLKDDEDVNSISDSTEDIILGNQNSNARTCKAISSLDTISERGDTDKFSLARIDVLTSITGGSVGTISGKLDTKIKGPDKEKKNKSKSATKKDIIKNTNEIKGKKNNKSFTNECNGFDYLYTC